MAQRTIDRAELMQVPPQGPKSAALQLAADRQELRCLESLRHELKWQDCQELWYHRTCPPGAPVSRWQGPQVHLCLATIPAPPQDKSQGKASLSQNWHRLKLPPTNPKGNCTALVRQHCMRFNKKKRLADCGSQTARHGFLGKLSTSTPEIGRLSSYENCHFQGLTQFSGTLPSYLPNHAPILTSARVSAASVSPAAQLLSWRGPGEACSLPGCVNTPHPSHAARWVLSIWVCCVRKVRRMILKWWTIV